MCNNGFERNTLLVNTAETVLLSVRLSPRRYSGEAATRALRDRTLYCLFYATRHPTGIEVFRDCQVKALEEQSRTRAATKVKHAVKSTGQREIFQSLHDMGPDDVTAFLESERVNAEKVLFELHPVPKTPS